MIPRRVYGPYTISKYGLEQDMVYGLWPQFYRPFRVEAGLKHDASFGYDMPCLHSLLASTMKAAASTSMCLFLFSILLVPTPTKI